MMHCTASDFQRALTLPIQVWGKPLEREGPPDPEFAPPEPDGNAQVPSSRTASIPATAPMASSADAAVLAGSGEPHQSTM